MIEKVAFSGASISGFSPVSAGEKVEKGNKTLPSVQKQEESSTEKVSQGGNGTKPHQAELPVLRQGEDPYEVSARNRIASYGETEKTQLLAQLGQKKGELATAETLPTVGERADGADGVEQTDKTNPSQCATCNERKYVDGSQDGSVSYQTPTHISPEQSASKVMAHEQEHVVNEKLYAKQEGREVLSQNVQIHQAICPDCGTSYVSGGLTTTVTAEKSQPVKSVQAKETEKLLADEGKVGEFLEVTA